MGPVLKPHCWFSNESAHFICSLGLFLEFPQLMFSLESVKTIWSMFSSLDWNIRVFSRSVLPLLYFVDF